MLVSDLPMAGAGELGFFNVPRPVSVRLNKQECEALGWARPHEVDLLVEIPVGRQQLPTALAQHWYCVANGVVAA